MLNKDLEYKLRTVIEVCEKHRQRMFYAVDSLEDIFPLNPNSVRKLSPEQVSHTDQLIYRFSRLQDTMGTKLFPLILQGLGEYDQGQPFIDMLNKLEKFSLIDSAEQWLRLREIRNLVSHEYPDNEKELAEGLNELRQESRYLDTVLNDLLRTMKERAWLTS
jgi:hypothetical protein